MGATHPCLIIHTENTSEEKLADGEEPASGTMRRKQHRKLSAKLTHQIPVHDTIAACMTMCRAGGPNQTTEQAY